MAHEGAAEQGQPEIDIGNWHMVTLQGDRIIILRPHYVMTKEQALVFAAWLVALADHDTHNHPRGEFFDILQKVRQS